MLILQQTIRLDLIRKTNALPIVAITGIIGIITLVGSECDEHLHTCADIRANSKYRNKLG